MNEYLYEVATRLVAFDTVSAKSDRDAMEYITSQLAPLGFKTAIQPIELFGVSQANLVAWVGPPRADGKLPKPSKGVTGEFYRFQRRFLYRN